MFRGLVFVAIAGLSAAAVIACSDSSTTAKPPSDVPRLADGAAILPDGSPNENVSCPLVTKAASCSVPSDLRGVKLGSAWASTNEDCETTLYIAKITDETNYTLARYTAKSVAPSCALALDADFEAGAPGDYLSADDAGNVYSVSPAGVVARISPLPSVPCETDLSGALTPSAMTMLRDGSRGYVGFSQKLAKLEPTPSGCKVTSVTLSEPIQGVINGLAIDTKGRVHVVDHDEKNEDRVAIYLATGEFVTAYRTGGGGKPLVAVRGITPCRGGLCVEDNGIAVAVDENGAYRAEAAWQPTEATSAHVFTGTVRGPFFSVSAVSGTPGSEKILVDLLAEHE